MAFSKLSGDEQGIILGQLRNALEPRLVMYFSSANKELRALLPPAVQQQLRADYEEATALCLNVGMRDCKELREATEINWYDKGLTAADLAKLAKLGSVLPALVGLWLEERSASAESPTGFPDGALRLADGLVAGALPALTYLTIGVRLGDAGASAFAAALDRGAMPRLRSLNLGLALIGDAALAALAPALRRRPALKQLYLYGNPFGDEGLAALVAPPPPAAGTPPPPPAGALKKLDRLDLGYTAITDAGCATLAAALDSGALPALEELELDGTCASDEAKAAVHEAMARSRFGALAEEAAALCVKLGMRSCKELREAKTVYWHCKGLSTADLATLAALGSKLPALTQLTFDEPSGSAGPDGVQRLADGLVAGALPAVSHLDIIGMHMGDAGASAIAAALDRGALPRLECLALNNDAIGDAALAALAPALRQRPALKQLYLYGNPFGDEGLAALVAPPRQAGGLKKLKRLGLGRTQVSDSGCATLAAALDCGALPALEELELEGTHTSDEAETAVLEALVRSLREALARSKRREQP